MITMMEGRKSLKCIDVEFIKQIVGMTNTVIPDMTSLCNCSSTDGLSPRLTGVWVVQIHFYK